MSEIKEKKVATSFEDKPKHAGGRPTKYTKELAAEICARLAEGEPVTKITKDEHMPVSSALYRWLTTNSEFKEMYEVARADGAHTFASQIVEIIDEDPQYVFDDKGNKRVDPGSIAQKRLKMDGRKWIAAKYLPKVYGDRTVVQGDSDADAVNININIFDEMIKNLELKRQTK
jgi:hypothetical protein